MSELVAFIEARLAEDEAEAATMHPDQQHGTPWNVRSRARVLAEVAAKRRIVAEHTEKRVGAVTFGPGAGLSREEMLAAFDARAGTECARCFDRGRIPAPCPTLRALASVYAGHEDWREEWAL